MQETVRQNLAGGSKKLIKVYEMRIETDEDIITVRSAEDGSEKCRVQNACGCDRDSAFLCCGKKTCVLLQKQRNYS